MTNQHPITPPPELVARWRAAASNVSASSHSDPGGRRDYIDYIATEAARWGADQELDACCEWIPKNTPWDEDNLRAARRPKPPSLKQQALAVLMALEIDEPGYEGTYDTIRRALECQ